MATRATPTLRQKRIGTELRRMRLAADVTTEAASTLLGIDRTRLSNMESGVRPISPDRIRTLAVNYACDDASYADALAELAAIKGRRWWEAYRGILPSGLLDIAELEWQARGVRTIQAVHLPGLLQTEPYARAVFECVLPAMTKSEVDHRVAHRMERQQVLDREGFHCLAYVHEAALRMQFGGRDVTREQLLHLAEGSERENVGVRVLPVEAGGFPGAGHAVLYADGAVPRLDTVQLDSAHGAEFMDADSQLAKYRAHLDWMEHKTLPADASREFIGDIIRTL